jgi:hypothetical protein
VLFDDIVYASLCGFCLCLLRGFLLSLLLALAGGFSVSGRNSRTSSGALSLAWW